jgi:hypothetical protein
MYDYRVYQDFATRFAVMRRNTRGNCKLTNPGQRPQDRSGLASGPDHAATSDLFCCWSPREAMTVFWDIKLP